MKGICDVHRLVLNDTIIRDLKWCRKCQSWICDQCRPNIALRAMAMAIKKLNLKTK